MSSFPCLCTSLALLSGTKAVATANSSKTALETGCGETENTEQKLTLGSFFYYYSLSLRNGACSWELEPRVWGPGAREKTGLCSGLPAKPPEVQGREGSRLWPCHEDQALGLSPATLRLTPALGQAQGTTEEAGPAPARTQLHRCAAGKVPWGPGEHLCRAQWCPDEGGELPPRVGKALTVHPRTSGSLGAEPLESGLMPLSHRHRPCTRRTQVLKKTGCRKEGANE